jgi:hypothetical protein
MTAKPATLRRVRSRLSIRLLIAGAALMAASSSGYAEPIRVVTGGFVDAHEGDNTFVLLGDGFRVSGEIPFSGPLSRCFPCTPGTAVSLSGTATPGIYGDPAVVDGTTYDGFSGFNGGPFLTGRFAFFAGSIVVPDVPVDGFAEFSSVFAFDGSLAGFDTFELTGPPLFSLGLTGFGTARLEFSHPPGLGILASRITYDFEPAAATPEPATLFLVAPLLGWSAWRRRGLRRS